MGSDDRDPTQYILELRPGTEDDFIGDLDARPGVELVRRLKTIPNRVIVEADESTIGPLLVPGEDSRILGFEEDEDVEFYDAELLPEPPAGGSPLHLDVGPTPGLDSPGGLLHRPPDPGVVLDRPAARPVSLDRPSPGTTPPPGGMAPGDTQPGSMPPAPTIHSGIRIAMERVNAPQAHACATGRGVTIAIIDTGVCGAHPYVVDPMDPMKPSRRLECQEWKDFSSMAGWDDYNGHGSMLATFAGGNDTAGPKNFTGVAPDARIMSLRVGKPKIIRIVNAYDLLLSGCQPAGPLVINNSYSTRKLKKKSTIRKLTIVELVELAIKKGAIVVFSAGNAHDGSHACQNEIGGINAHEQVITVGNLDLKDVHQHDSSTGDGANGKPDVIAPAYGRVIYTACKPATSENWGTSGACAIVSGLAALILEQHPGWSHAQVKSHIKSTTQGLLGHAPCVVGDGLVDCASAVGCGAVGT